MTALSALMISLALTLSTADAKPRGSSPDRGGQTTKPRDSAPAKPTRGNPAPKPVPTRNPPAPTRNPPTPTRNPPAPTRNPRTPGQPVYDNPSPRTPEASRPSTLPAPQGAARNPDAGSPRDGLPTAVGSDPLGIERDGPVRNPSAGGPNAFRPSGPAAPGFVTDPSRPAVAGAEPVTPVQQGYQTRDHRYARPHYAHVHDCGYATYATPHRYTYRPYYTRWYVHPYYRWQYSTYIMVHTGYGTMAWVDTWIPPHRAGWIWMPGFWAGNYWNPGYWAPAAPPPVHYVYVPGYWEREVYVDGYYRSDAREDGDWEWIEGLYLEDGSYVPGHWRPTEPGPEGYTWEPGFWDGEAYIDGFWRPMYRDGFSWSGAYFDANGVYHSGFWEPLDPKQDQVWVPGWFDGNAWQDGYFVPNDVYYAANPEEFDAPEGWDAGWDVGNGWGDGEVVERHGPDDPDPVVNAASKERRLGIPVE
ncbi:MAG: hypothetical protein KC912_10865 [Proteobacteria bacterium]|nr:hypothetical protein [Pseudomonadota bacterium]